MSGLREISVDIRENEARFLVKCLCLTRDLLLSLLAGKQVFFVNLSCFGKNFSYLGGGGEGVKSEKSRLNFSDLLLSDFQASNHVKLRDFRLGSLKAIDPRN